MAADSHSGILKFLAKQQPREKYNSDHRRITTAYHASSIKSLWATQKKYPYCYEALACTLPFLCAASTVVHIVAIHTELSSTLCQLCLLLCSMKGVLYIYDIKSIWHPL